MTTAAPSLRAYIPDYDLMNYGGIPTVYHCHHFNLFLDQTVDDALGAGPGFTLRFTAAREASHHFIRALVTRAGAVTAAERLEVAQQTFSAMGHGRLLISGDRTGGTATGEFLHYGFAWAEKYGQKVRRRTPADAFAAGYAAAALEVACSLERESVLAEETACIATRSPQCTFKLTIGKPPPPLPPVREAEVRAKLKPLFHSAQGEETIAAIAKGLKDFTAGVAGDERGLVQAFGVFVTMHLAGYYNRISYDALATVVASRPAAVPMLEELLRESGHVCVFNTFGGILASPEWEAMVGKHSGDPLQIVLGNLAIARALGFGHWTLAEYVPNERMVLRAPATYESVYYQSRHGTADRPSEYFFQGATLAIAQLAHRIDWRTKPVLTQEFYAALFQGGRLPWKVEQTQCTACGHEYSEVVATRVG
jgi:hypothetical protein